MSRETNETEFDGMCAFAVSLGKFDAEGDPKITLELNGRTYQFAHPIVRFLWRVIPGLPAKAHTRWSSRGSG